MNYDTSSENQNETTTGAPSSGAPSSPSHDSKSDPFAHFSESVRKAFQNGGRDARRAFDEALPKAKDDLARGINDLAYALAYVTAFGGALAREITPDTMKDSLRDGTSSGKRSAEEMIRQRREKAERTARETPTTDGDPVTA